MSTDTMNTATDEAGAGTDCDTGPAPGTSRATGIAATTLTAAGDAAAAEIARSISIVPLDPQGHAEEVHAWLTHPRSHFWQMTDFDRQAVGSYLEAIRASADENGWIGLIDGAPAFYVETYAPSLLIPTAVIAEEPGDIGMHLLIAPPQGRTRSGLTDAVMARVIDFCLRPHSQGGRGASRVVVEPDVGNPAIHAKNAAAGFRVIAEAEVPLGETTKTALVSTCTRTDFATSRLGRLIAGAGVTGNGGDDEAGDGDRDRQGERLGEGDPEPLTQDDYAHLTPEAFAVVSRHLVAKSIAEFAHERLIAPSQNPEAGEHAWVLTIPGDPDSPGSGPDDHPAAPVIHYTFEARVLPLEHWVIDDASISRFRDGRAVNLDAQEFVLELQDSLGVPEDLISTYLEELASTVAGSAFKLTAARRGERPDSAALADADFQTIEAAMTEGHPGFIANNGRIGFGLRDYRRWAPETGRRNRLDWVAVDREQSHLALGDGLDEERHLAWTLSDDERELFDSRLAAVGRRLEDVHLMPVHPWQADHRLAITFAADIARGGLIPLGPGLDDHQAQQSLRTFFNHSRPGAPYVKVALAVQNMGFLRGLSPTYMRDTPAINDWVARLVDGDQAFAAAGFRLLRERSAIGYTGDVYHRTRATNPHRKMLAGLWRENPLPLLTDGQRTMTMAALLHRDHLGESLVSHLIRRSGLSAEDWVRAYLRAYLQPLVHGLLAHDLVFMPHGENLILILDAEVVTGVFMKDIGEEVAYLGEGELPPAVERIRAVVPGEEKALAIFTDVFDGVLRHLAGILDVDGLLEASRFWALVAEVLDAYQGEHAEVARGIAGDIDLRAPRFKHSCLNRLQLRNTKEMVDIGNQADSLIFAGTMRNPVGR
ncbi:MULTISPECIES: GNAT family N-acetyltransferase [unclassified Brevibacterium]|uniref:GNAT family N-acetyltransferase n=1 Tax=unclassified Brevibacterium TaxID=2614124 RepID=UPI002017B515|nr:MULTISPECIES: GNAT family N-acetyltransferase [unclassified Brevibacterium]MCM1011631.1 GNAT family N-acetyltransferase [Brevibacterium sp. XM4083]